MSVVWVCVVCVEMKIGLLVNVLKYGGGFECYVIDIVWGMVEVGVMFVFFVCFVDVLILEVWFVELYWINVLFLFGKLCDEWFLWWFCGVCCVVDVDVLIGCNWVVCLEIVICGGIY